MNVIVTILMPLLVLKKIHACYCLAIHKVIKWEWLPIQI